MSRRSPLPWLGGILVLYLTVPLVAFAWRASTSRVTGFTSPGLWPALRTSVESATLATLIVALTGVPLAYLLARRQGPAFRVLNTLVVLPLALSPVMGGIILIYLIGPYTTLGRAFHQHLTGSVAGIVLSQVFVAAPFLVISARSAFGAVDRSLEDLAATLGHRPLARFFLVDLAVASSGIRAGLLLTWLRAIGEYGANVIVAYHPYSLPVFTYVQFSDTGIPTTQAPTVLVLAAAAVAVGVSQIRLPRRHRRLPTGDSFGRGPDWPVTPIGFDLDVRVGEFHLVAAYHAVSHRLAVLGPSGSGKSMTLRSIAGLIARGRVSYAGVDVDPVPVDRRGIGYVPQGQNLLPHLDVTRQVLFGRGADPGLARHWIDALGLTGLETRRPSQLSGGQRQRVSLAASLARRPQVLLLDEPFSALDAPVRVELRAAVRRLQLDGLSTVLVTHDPLEAAELSDEVVVISAGRVLQAGPTAEVFEHPVSPEVARLVGFENVVPAAVADGGVSIGSVLLPMAVPVSLEVGSEVWVGIRSEAIVATDDGPFSGEVLDRSPFGGVVSLAGGPPLRVRSARPLGSRYDVVAASVIPAAVSPNRPGTSPASQSDGGRS